jgi:CRISPR-associated protein Csx17
MAEKERIAWLDAAYVAGDEARYPAILGTGGNDGRFDFANRKAQNSRRTAIAATLPKKRLTGEHTFV